MYIILLIITINKYIYIYPDLPTTAQRMVVSITPFLCPFMSSVFSDLEGVALRTDSMKT